MKSQQERSSGGKITKGVIFSGGTFSHISPHLALAAPAFGTVGKEIFDTLSSINIGDNIRPNVFLRETRMANSESDIVTNEDLKSALAKAATRVNFIFFPAAVCDFKKGSLTVPDPFKQSGFSHVGQDRLDSSKVYDLKLIPEQKILPTAKYINPDLFLVSFKTTYGLSYSESIEIGFKSLNSNDADIVFVNDIKNKQNALVCKTGATFLGTREECIKEVCRLTLENVLDTCIPEC